MASEPRIVWAPPPSKWFKLNTDGCCNKSTGIASGGGVARDELGRWVLGFSAKFYAASPIAAEFLVLHQGLIYCGEHGLDNLFVEVDAKCMLDILGKVNAANHDLGVVAEDVFELLDRNWSVHMTWAKREANELANLLASMAYDNMEDRDLFS